MSIDERELVMLSPVEKNEISKEIDRYEQKSAVCIDALRIVQNHRGWISDQAILDIASFLQISPADVDSVATFYNLIFRRPVGRHVIFICDSVSCWIMGCDRIKRKLCHRLEVGLGENSADGAFTLLPIACLGQCERAPAILVDGEPMTHITEGSVDELITRLLEKDTQGGST